jgi:antitoxin HicB
MEKKTLTYRILLNEEPEGGFTVTVPALSGCVTYGENLDEAMSMAKEAIEGYILVLKENGESRSSKRNLPFDSKTKQV